MRPEGAGVSGRDDLRVAGVPQIARRAARRGGALREERQVS